MLEGGAYSAGSCAAAIECQDLPDTPNLAPGRMRLTGGGEDFERTVIWEFGER